MIRMMYFKQMDDLITVHEFYLITLTVATAISLKAFLKNWAKPLKWLSSFLFMTFLMEFFAVGWIKYLHSTDYWTFSQSNLWIYNAFLIVGYPLLFIYFRGFVTKSKRIIFDAILFVYELFALINFIWIEGLHLQNSNTFLIINLLVIGFTVYFISWLITRNKMIKLSHSTEVWVAIGVFLYHSGTVPIFIAFNVYHIDDPDLATSLLYINHALNILMHITFVTAFLCKPKFLISQ